MNQRSFEFVSRRARTGMTPAKRDVGPSSLIIFISVPIVVGFFAVWLLGRSPLASSFLAVIRVFTTQMGFVRITVALPAMAPAIIDSTVVSFLDGRPEVMAALSKPDLVHSYPEAVSLSVLHAAV